VRLDHSRLSCGGRRAEKVLYLRDAWELADRRVPPGNRLEPLKGRWKGLYSIRINDQWRVVFKFERGTAFEVAVLDYH